MPSQVTVQYFKDGQYGETTAKSENLTVQQIVDELHKTAKPGVALRFIADAGIIVPSGFVGDARLYIEH